MKKVLLLLIVSFFRIPDADALPSYQEVRRSYVKSDSLLLDRHGEVIHEMRTDKDRRRLEWISLSDVSPSLKEAVIQAEDRRFFSHSGVDYRAVGGAMLQGFSSESLRGASTITMQLASFLNKEIGPGKTRKSIWQKGQQVLTAWEIEKSWSKEEILETYLNLVTYRGELQGIMASSRGLFGKDPHGLDRAESLVLASLLRSPNASFSEIWPRAFRLNESIGWKVPTDEIRSKVNQIFLGPSVKPRMFFAPHLARRLLKERPKGSTVTSALDLRMQQFALSRLAHHLLILGKQNVRDGAILVVENRTGNVLVYMSHSSGRSQVDGVQAKRQAGSTLKPLLYALAFDRRVLTPASILNDTPLDLSVVNGIYQPRNYDSDFKGHVTARVALASSLNVPAVRTLSLVGNESFLRILRQAGIKGLREAGDFYGPSLALGSADVSLWELTNAYRSLANHGEWSDLRPLPEAKPADSRRIFSREAAFLVSDILSDREARSSTFGLENSLATRYWTAVKTGTSKDMRDNWCIGYSQKYTVGVWIGNFSGEPMWNVSGITGAAPLWVEMMNLLHQNEPSAGEKPPANVVSRKVEFSEEAEFREKEWFIRGTEPRSADRKILQFNQRILYPPHGAIIAVDPDIPPEVQRVFFVSQAGRESLKWVLNGIALEETGKTVSWSPRVGTHSLAMLDPEGNVLDSVHFEVRGPTEE